MFSKECREHLNEVQETGLKHMLSALKDNSFLLRAIANVPSLNRTTNQFENIRYIDKTFGSLDNTATPLSRVAIKNLYKTGVALPIGTIAAWDTIELQKKGIAETESAYTTVLNTGASYSTQPTSQIYELSGNQYVVDTSKRNAVNNVVNFSEGDYRIRYKPIIGVSFVDTKTVASPNYMWLNNLPYSDWGYIRLLANGTQQTI